jgi:alpha-L-rhamnosidase
MIKSIPIGIALAVLLATASGISTAPPAPDLTVSRLLVDGAADPIGIDAAPPRLSWRLESDVRGQRQTAYRVLVASSRATLDKEMGDLWDSGQVTSNERSGRPP